MATHAGKEGQVKVGSDQIKEVKEWSIDETAETVDSTSLDNAGWRTHKPTLNSWSGSLSLFWDETDTNGQGALTIGAAVAILNFYPEGDATGDRFASGSATITGVSTSAAVDGMVEQSISFQGNGALTWSDVV